MNGVIDESSITPNAAPIKASYTAHVVRKYYRMFKSFNLYCIILFIYLWWLNLFNKQVKSNIPASTTNSTSLAPIKDPIKVIEEQQVFVECKSHNTKLDLLNNKLFAI